MTNTFERWVHSENDESRSEPRLPYVGRETDSSRAFVEKGWIYMVCSTARLDDGRDEWESKPN